MHIFLQFNGRWTPKADRVARTLRERHGFTRFSGISTGEGHALWLRKPANTPVPYHHVQPLPEIWRKALERGRPDPGRLRELESRYGCLWRYVLADRNLGHTFLTDTVLPRTPLRAACARQEPALACLQALFDYFEERFGSDRPNAVFFQVVASAPSLVAAAVCGHLRIPFFTLGKTKMSDRHHLASNALMYPDQAVEAYADANLAAGPEAAQLFESWSAAPAASDHHLAERALQAQRHGQTLAAFLRETVATLPAALAKRDKPYAPDPRETPNLEKWRWETAIRWNYRRHRAAELFAPAVPEGPYVYFALSVTPEASTCVVAPGHADQYHAIAALSRSIPAGWNLVIKDHVPMCGRRTRAFYERIRALPNTALVEPTLRSPDIARGAEVVCVIAGTTGWEAQLMGRPVVALGAAWFLATGLAVHCPHLEDLPGAIQRARAQAAATSGPERRNRCARFIQALLDHSFPLDYGLMWKHIPPEQTHAAHERLDHLAGRLATRVRAASAGGPPNPFDTSAWDRDRTPAAG